MKQSGTFFVKGEKIVLKKDGTWIADGIEITHEQTREVFYRSIHWDVKEKKFCLKIGYETLFIEVEDTPYFVTSIEHKKNQTFAHLTNGTHVTVTASNINYDNETLYLKTSDGQKARFLSAAFYEILKDLKEDSKTYYLTIEGQKAILAKKDGTKASRPGALKRLKG